MRGSVAGSARGNPRAATLALLLLGSGLAARAEEKVHESGLRYEVVPPPGWDGKAPLDLVLCLHGSGDKLADWRTGMGLLVPELRRTLRLFVQSPLDHGWPGEVAKDLAAITREVRDAHPVRRTIVFGFSAGGNVATLCLFGHPDLFQGALVGGATVAIRPPREGPAKERSLCFSIGADDPIVPKMGGVEALRGLFRDSGWSEEQVRIDLPPGIGHTISRPHFVEGLSWLLDRAGEGAPASEAERARVSEAEALVERGDRDGLWRLVKELGTAGREARGLLAARLEPLLSEKDPPRLRLGCELLAWLAAPGSVPALDRALDRTKRDPEGCAAVARALGRIPDPAAEKALLQLFRRAAFRGAPQLAAAEGLALVAGDGALRPMVDALRAAEERKDEALAAALERALREATGQPLLQGGVQWSAWLRQRR